MAQRYLYVKMEDPKSNGNRFRGDFQIYKGVMHWPSIYENYMRSYVAWNLKSGMT